MKKRKLDPKELTKEFNELRLKNVGKTFLSSELDELLHRFGFNQNLIWEMKRQKFFMCIQSKQSKIYQFREEPLFWINMNDALREYRRKLKKKTNEEPVNLTPEEASIKLLKEKGYKIKVNKGFDLEAFKKDYPELFKQYQKYEYV